MTEIERRVSRSRRSIEVLLDGVLRPGGWAAKIALRLGLQGRVATTRTTVVLHGRRTGAPLLRVGFASDFHAGATTHPSLLVRACEALAAERPDLVLFGGDFVSVRASYMRLLTPLLAAIPAPLGKFAVLGNHDLRADCAKVVAGLHRADVELLTNRCVRLPAPFDDITLCGLDDPTIGHPRADLAMDEAAGARIVLMHSPEGLDAIGERHFDFAICGHTHGGQIAWPSGRPILIPGGALNRTFPVGQYDLGGTTGKTMLVSRGVGCSTLPFRVFATPEVHLITIQPGTT